MKLTDYLKQLKSEVQETLLEGVGVERLEVEVCVKYDALEGGLEICGQGDPDMVSRVRIYYQSGRMKGGALV